MARNVDNGRSGKIHPKGVVPHAVGPVNNINDAAKFHSAPKGGRTPSNGVEEQAKGAVFHCNETLIPTPSADKAPKESKVIASHQGGSINIGSHKTSGDLTASQEGDGAPTNKPYPLKDRYDKHGTKDSGRLPRNG